MSILIAASFFRRNVTMKVEAYYPQRLFISLVILLCVLTLGPAMRDLMVCQAQSQESGRRAPSRSPDGPGVTGAVADVSEDYRINPDLSLRYLMSRHFPYRSDKLSRLRATVHVESGV